MTAPGIQNRTSSSASAGLVTATFSLYEFQEGGSPLWSEAQKVQLDEQGRYVVLLGAASPAGLPLDLFTSGKALWLGVQPQWSGTGELPRVLLVAVPYALKASDSDTLGGKPASAFALAGAPTVVAVEGGAALSSPSANPAQQASLDEVVAGKSTTAMPLAACTAVTSGGTAAAGEIAKFTAACNIEKSLLRDTGTAVAVGGTATPGALLDVQFTSTAASGTLLGQRVLTTLNPAAASSAFTNGLFSDTLTATGNKQNFGNLITGTVSRADHNGTGTLFGGVGLTAGVVNFGAGTITSAYALQTIMSNASTGKITNGYGLYVNAPYNATGGTFSNFTGVYIASPSAVAGAYGLYSAGGKNYFAGDVGIETTTPGANLEVNGTAKFDGLVTFGTGQTFPIPAAGVTDAMLANPYSGVGACGTGKVVTTLTRNAAPSCLTMSTGTVTSVASGSGLTGGPIITSGTLSVDTTKIPTLAASSNIFKGSITASSFTGSGAGLTGVSASGLAAGTYSNAYTFSNAANSFTAASVTAGSVSATNGVSGASSTGTGYGVHGSNTATLGNAYGVYGTSSSSGGFGVYGSGATGVGGAGTTGYGVVGTTSAGTSDGVYGLNTATTGNAYGVAGTSNSTTGTGVYGSGAFGVYGVSSNSGTGPGIYAGFAVFGSNTATTGYANGVGGTSNSPSGYGVYGTGLMGVFGSSTVTGGAGLYGDQGSGTNAGEFSGPVYVSGALTKAGGGFKIDHPQDPANKYLVHSFVESPDMKNVYDGVAVVDANGEAWIDLPEWFETLNRDFRYQLTAVGAPAPGLYIAAEISGNRFKIAGGKPGGKVSWQVTGIRQDVWAKAHRLPVEEEKPPAEKGSYLHPELYGQPKEKGFDWAHHPQPMRPRENASKLPRPVGGGAP
jgi:hypothetical protein